MEKDIIINATNEETRIVIREDGKVVELFVEAPEHDRMVGDIYKGKVSRVLPGMKAAFIDIGHEQNAFLHFSDVNEGFQDFFMDDEDEEEEDEQQNNDKNDRRNNNRGKGRRKPRGFYVERELKKNQDILVQIVKEPISSKGCRVTSDITLAGRFVVLIPNQKHIGISRKIAQHKERRRLKDLARQLLPKNFGVIIRTVAEGRSEKELKKDINDLIQSWQKLDAKIQNEPSPCLIYKDMAVASGVIRDLFTSDVTQIHVDSRRMMKEISDYVKDVAPQLVHKIHYYKGKLPIFDEFGIEKEIAKITESKVWLNNGGYIIIQPTEALVSIDVNSGKFIGRKDHESNSLKINLEAAREISRQARLRDIGGLMVIDFIDVMEEENKRKIALELKKEFAKDRAITKIEDMSRFGLVEMTRQRTRPGVIHTMYEPCPHCEGKGLVPTVANAASRMERWVQRYRAQNGDRRITIHVTPELYNHMIKGRYNKRLKLMWKYWMKIKLHKSDDLDIGEFKVYDHHNKRELVLQEEKKAA